MRPKAIIGMSSPLARNTPDYPKLAVWPDAYYWTANTFFKCKHFRRRESLRL